MLCALDMIIFFFFNDTATTEIYTLSLHDALPISRSPPANISAAASMWRWSPTRAAIRRRSSNIRSAAGSRSRSEEHTSELQSRQYLVCRLLLEKKKKNHIHYTDTATNTPMYSRVI